VRFDFDEHYDHCHGAGRCALFPRHMIIFEDTIRVRHIISLKRVSVQVRCKHKLEGGIASNFRYCYSFKFKFMFFLGLRVAHWQLQLIFNLPPQFGYFHHPLTYIEWFTPLGRFDPNSVLSSCSITSITPSTRHNQRKLIGCHLILILVKIFHRHGLRAMF
jgi:hypothetical protein